MRIADTVKLKLDGYNANSCDFDDRVWELFEADGSVKTTRSILDGRRSLDPLEHHADADETHGSTLSVVHEAAWSHNQVER